MVLDSLLRDPLSSTLQLTLCVHCAVLALCLRAFRTRFARVAPPALAHHLLRSHTARNQRDRAESARRPFHPMCVVARLPPRFRRRAQPGSPTAFPFPRRAQTIVRDEPVPLSSRENLRLQTVRTNRDSFLFLTTHRPRQQGQGSACRKGQGSRRAQVVDCFSLPGLFPPLQ